MLDYKEGESLFTMNGNAKQLQVVCTNNLNKQIPSITVQFIQGTHTTSIPVYLDAYL